MQQFSPRNEENINDIRKVIREQSFLNSNVHARRFRSSNSDSSDDIEIPIRRFTPLPDIPRVDDAYFRTESKLIKNEIQNESMDESQPIDIIEINDQLDVSNLISIDSCEKEQNLSTKSILFDDEDGQQKSFKRDTRYHFNLYSCYQNKKILLNQRLPAIEKKSDMLQNCTDLGEDLSMNVIGDETLIQNQRLVYTSPGDRIISPIKRPQAPSPAAGAYRRKAKQKSDTNSDNDIFIR